jgi:prepilin-type processing-associated H-X9-DG protein
MNEGRSKVSLPPISEIGAVTIVIAVLAAAMVPAVTAARQQEEQKQQAACMSNEKQLGLGLLEYTQDYDEIMPACYKGAPQTWAGRVMPYIKSTSILTCPADQTQSDGTVKPSSKVVSYALNSNFRDKSTDGVKRADCGMKLADFESPAHTVTFFEVAGAQVQLSLSDEGTTNYTKTPPTKMLSPAGDGNGSGPEWGYAGKSTSPITYAVERHQQGANFAACDGHVIWSLPDLVSTGTDNPSSTGLQGNPPDAAAGTSNSHYRLTFSTK